MKKSVIFIVVIIILALAAIIYFHNQSAKTSEFKNQTSSQANITPMTITSAAFTEGQAIPKKYSCDGDGVNPPLEFSGVPTETQSLALVIDDPDATPATWTHWLVWNILPSVTSIAENSVPEKAIQGKASSGQNVYGSLCPPNGLHHYHFKLFALDSLLTIPPYSDVNAFTQAINGHTITSAELIGTYSRGQ